MKPWEKAKKPWEKGSKVDIPKKPPDEPWYEDMAEGIGVSGLDLYYGIKSLGGELSAEDKAHLKDWKDDAAQSGYGTAGRILGEIAQMALPGGAVLKGVKALSKAVGMGRKASLGAAAAGEAGVGAGFGYARVPGEGEDRATGAVREAAGSLVGSGVGAALGKAYRGIRKTPEGEALIKQNVDVTPGQVAESPAVRGLEGIMDIAPGLSRGTKKAREEGIDSWALATMKQAAPNPDGITEIGTKGFNQSKGQIDKLYKDAWSDAGGVNKETSKAMRKEISGIYRVVPQDEKAVVQGIGQDIKALTKGDPKPDKLKSIDTAISKQINKARDNPKLVNDLQFLKDMLRDSMPPGVHDKLRNADSFYPKFLTIKKATYKARQNEGKFNPAQAIDASADVGKGTKNTIESGTSPLYDIIMAGKKTVGRKKEATPLSAIARISDIVPSPPMKGMGNIVLGATPFQKGVQGLSKSPTLQNIKALGANPARLSSAYADKENKEERWLRQMIEDLNRKNP